MGESISSRVHTWSIEVLPDHTSSYMCRAVCYAHLKDWTLVKSDCERVLLKDPSNAKAHYFLGISLRETGDYMEGVTHLQKALDLARIQNLDLPEVNDIKKELDTAKHLQWKNKAPKRLVELEQLRKACRIKIEENLKYDMSKTRRNYPEQIKLVDEVFAKAFKADEPKEVPPFLCCPITLDIFTDLVIVPSGNTFDREAIINQLKIQKKDPISRKRLQVHDLIPNKAIRSCVEAFQEEYGWQVGQ